MKRDVNRGVPTSRARGIPWKNFNIINTVIPQIIDEIAVLLSHFLNVGRRPRIIGIAIGPSNAANHETIRPKTPPKCLAFTAIIIVRRVNENVDILAIRRCFFLLRLVYSLIKQGSMSLVITAEIVFASDEVIDNVFVKRAASTSPTNPAGRNLSASRPYALVGSPSSGIKSGAENIGKNNIIGHNRYKTDDSVAAFFASLPEEEAINLVARCHVPPL